MKALKHFTNKRFKRLHDLLNAIADGNEKEALHQIRLEIKKIKAILRLIHFNDKQFRDHKHYRSLRTIFREAGSIRDASLRQELLNQYTQIHTPFFRSSDKPAQIFLGNIPAHIKKLRHEKKRMIKEVSTIKTRTYSLYLHKKNEELTYLLSEGISQKELHGLRKLIKEINYLTSVKTKKSKIDPFLIESASLIGHWHDKKIIIPWIRSHAPHEKDTIKKLQTESNSDIQQLRKMIKEKLKKVTGHSKNNQR